MESPIKTSVAVMKPFSFFPLSLSNLAMRTMWTEKIMSKESVIKIESQFKTVKDSISYPLFIFIALSLLYFFYNF